MEVHKRVAWPYAHPEQRVERFYPEQRAHVHVHEERQRRQSLRGQCREFERELPEEGTTVSSYSPQINLFLWRRQKVFDLFIFFLFCFSVVGS